VTNDVIYTTPFTDSQRPAAARMCRAHYACFDLVEDAYPPEDEGQRKLFGHQEDLVDALMDELIQPNDEIRVDRLNDLESRSSACFKKYLFTKLKLARKLQKFRGVSSSRLIPVRSVTRELRPLYRAVLKVTAPRYGNSKRRRGL